MLTGRLVRHPSSSDQGLHGIAARIARSADGVLSLTYTLDGDLARIHIPGPTERRVTHRLWEHTCCEAFIAVEGAAGYWEFNFSPSGEWAGYAFRDYREAEGIADDASAPAITVRRALTRLELEAHISLPALSSLHERATLCIGLAAVIESHDGTLSYWSLHHPAGAPDFHHADARALRLEPSPAEW
jgi:hypothetical protein